LAHYRTGAQAGRPAVTRRPTGTGSAAYVSTRLGADGLAALLPRLLGPAGVASELPAGVRGRVETTVRRGPGGRFRFLVNRTDDAVTVPGLTGEVLVGSTGEDGAVVLAPGDVAVLRTPTG
ncbi:beta-galactosidase, partial [Streptomyces sp. SID5914]